MLYDFVWCSTQNGRRLHQKWKMSPPKMEGNLTQNGRRPYPKWKTTSPKMEDNITQNGRLPLQKSKTTSTKMKTNNNENNQKWRLPNWRGAKIKTNMKEWQKKIINKYLYGRTIWDGSDTSANMACLYFKTSLDFDFICHAHIYSIGLPPKKFLQARIWTNRICICISYLHLLHSYWKVLKSIECTS